jgi:hypothetical protein
MNWEAIGAIGEIIGASAVVISIVYLSIQIRQNSRVSKTMAIQNWAAAAALEKSSIFSDREFAELIAQAAIGDQDFEVADKLRIETYFIQLFNTFELLYFQKENGTIDAAFFHGKATAYQNNLLAPGIRNFWNETRLTHFDERFRRYIDHELEKLDKA